MKKLLALTAIILFSASLGFSQKFAYVDTEYILEQIPAYAEAKTQLDELSQSWQEEIDALYAEVEELYQKYQADRVLLSEEMRRKREDEIINKEKEVKELQQTYFGPEGDLYQKRQELIKPLQDDMYNAIREFAEQGRYAIIFGITEGSVMVLYQDEQYDRSDDILHKLGIED